MCRPTPSASAAARSSPVSTSWRTESRPPDMISVAPEAKCARREGPPESGAQFRARPGTEQSRTDSGRIRQKCPGKYRSRRQRPRQFGRTQCGQVGVERGDRRGGARGTHHFGAVRQRRVEARRRGVRHDPRPQRREPRSGGRIVRDDRHIPYGRAGQCGRHGVLGEREGETGPQPVVRRSRQPALGQGQRLQGYDQGPEAGRCEDRLRVRGELLVHAHRAHCRPDLRRPRGEGAWPGRTVFSTDQRPGATLDPQQPGNGPVVRGRCPSVPP
ncbi:hypothetical protein QFZ68_005004 [Streptomyces sp. V1I6]|nr:hypothetical protein [Streptomyces sp. V1I6]